MKLEGIPTNIVMGATGAGKTSFILRLLAARPPAERWAILANDFGRAALADFAPGSPDLVIREVAGCICCTAQIALRTAVVALIRETRPHRLLVEASAAAAPESVLSVLREPGIASAIKLGPAFTILARHQLADPRYRLNAAYDKQLRAADVVLTHAASAAELAAARAELEAHGFAANRAGRLDTFDVHALLTPSA